MIISLKDSISSQLPTQIFLVLCGSLKDYSVETLPMIFASLLAYSSIRRLKCPLTLHRPSWLVPSMTQTTHFPFHLDMRPWHMQTMIYNNWSWLLSIPMYSANINLSFLHESVPRPDISRVNVPPSARCAQSYVFKRPTYSQGPHFPLGLPQSHSQACQLQNWFSWWGCFSIALPCPYKNSIERHVSGRTSLLSLHVNIQKTEAFVSSYSSVSLQCLLSTCRTDNHVI